MKEGIKRITKQRSKGKEMGGCKGRRKRERRETGIRRRRGRYFMAGRNKDGRKL